MELLDLESMTKTIAEQLVAADDWTVKKLATTTVKVLLSYSRISIKKAEIIIAEAKELVNQEGIKQFKELNYSDFGRFTGHPEPVKKMSLRVRRAKASKAENK